MVTVRRSWSSYGIIFHLAIGAKGLGERSCLLPRRGRLSHQTRRTVKSKLQLVSLVSSPSFVLLANVSPSLADSVWFLFYIHRVVVSLSERSYYSILITSFFVTVTLPPVFLCIESVNTNNYNNNNDIIITHPCLIPTIYHNCYYH